MSEIQFKIHELHQAPSPYRDRVRAAISSTSGRERGLLTVINRMAPQVDELFVYLNGMSSIPSEVLPSPANVRFYTGPDLGDSANFVFLDGFTGYYVPLSDHVTYSRNHVISLISSLEQYGRRAVIGFRQHDPTQQSQTNSSGETINLDGDFHHPQRVDSLATESLMFHTDTLRLSTAILRASSTATYLAAQARQQFVSMIVVPETKQYSISPSSKRFIRSKATPSSQSPEDERVTKAEQMVDEGSPQTMRPSPCPLARPKKVTIIGRANTSRWKKGGILKSVLLTEEMLAAHGCNVELVDIKDGDVFNLDDPDVLLVYVGDPERPDFKHVHKIVDYHAKKGVPTLVNLSEDNNPKRTQEIQKIMSHWHNRFRGLVSMLVFSQNVDSRPEYAAFSDSIVTIPKTLIFSPSVQAEYYSTSGIFVGDVAKLADPRIVGSRVSSKLGMLRAAIPEAKIYGLQQYKSKYDIPKGIDEIWPYMASDELSEKLVNMRMMISFPRYATYEMVPVEASALGLPVLYPNMPQSLNEALGFAGYRYRDEFDLVNSARTIYRDPVIWRQFSQSGQRRARSQDFDVTTSKIYLALKNFVEKHRGRIWS